MASTKRYIVSAASSASRLAGGPLGPLVLRPLNVGVAALALPADAKAVKATPGGRQVVEMTETQALSLQQGRPDLLVEEDVPLRRFQGIPGLAQSVPNQLPHSFHFRVLESESGQPVQNVTVYGLGNGFTYKSSQVTDPAGVTTVLAAENTLKSVLASPRSGYWSRLVGDIEVADAVIGNPLTIKLFKLPETGNYDWGHTLMGFPSVNRLWTGRGIRVGVIDSGVSSARPDLRPKGGINTLDGEDPRAWDNDLEGHGSHCAGVISAQPVLGGVLGGASQAEIFSIRVFPGGYLSDLVQAVEWCILNKMDVISMSLGMSERKQQLFDVLSEAYNSGISCVAATGNDSQQVAYPAAFETVIAVTAIGHMGTFPHDSGHSLKVGLPSPLVNGVFAANFNNVGQEVSVCAPGVAVRSTVPWGYAAWDGTSMACPMISAMIALILEAYPQIRTNSSSQVEYVKAILRQSSISLGFPHWIQGSGMPIAGSALAGAGALVS